VQTEAADNRRAPQLDRTVITALPVDGFPGYATSIDFFTAYGLRAAEGTLFIQDDLDAGNLVIVLGSELAETLFPRGGAVGARISLWYQTVTVVGILEPTPLVDSVDLTPYNAAAFTPMATLAKAWSERAFVSNMRFATSDSEDAEAAVAQVTSYFESAHPDTNLMITSSIGQLKDERRTLSRTIVVLVFLTAVGLFIAAINLLNLMLIRIVKHTKNIGIMRALGWSRRDIFRQFMSESALMCVIGAVIGTAVSPLVYELLQTTIISGEGFASQTFVLDLIVGAAMGLLFSLAFGLYPAYLAKDTDTSAAVRTE
jgi:putative ABC transport system permease protein